MDEEAEAVEAAGVWCGERSAGEAAWSGLGGEVEDVMGEEGE